MREPLYSSAISRHAARMVAKVGADAVFVLGASPLAAGLANRFPVFHCSDATFAAMLDYHGEFTHLSKRTIRAGTELERKALVNSTAAILASDWAAQSARADYDCQDGVHVVPFGANLDELPDRDIWQQAGRRSLVFIGVNWYDKGADVAVAATRLLNERGISVVLHVVGCSPPADQPVMPFVQFHGFLRKQNPAEYSRLTELIAHADFLLLPTRFEAFGIVFCEAAAYGTPSVSRKIGGIPTIIEDGLTGALLPREAGAEAYADRIQELWADSGRYERMRRSAFEKSRRTLNWDAWGASVEGIIRRGVQSRQSTCGGSGRQ
jgi:glycosyltransferase involved in cell wall biosynthesis